MSVKHTHGLVGWSRRPVCWRLGEELHISVVFTWDMAQARAIAGEHRGHVVLGGPAAKLLYPDPRGCTWAEVRPPTACDVLSMHNPLATRTTLGCPNRCSFCAVPALEGTFREIPVGEWKVAPILIDSNLLAASRAHFERVIDVLVAYSFPAVDFNQGLEARRFTSWHAHQIARLRNPMVRFAWDHTYQEAGVAAAVEFARAAGIAARRIRIYVLVGFEDTPEEARYRLETIRSWGIKPNPMRYQPLDALERNAFVGPGWTARLLRKTCRYYARDIFRRIPFDEFEEMDDELPLFTRAKGEK